MGGEYKPEFTKAFKRAQVSLALCAVEVEGKADELARNPFLGREIGGLDGVVRAWDVSFLGKRNFIWYYVIDPNMGVIENVLIIPVLKNRRNYADDILLMSRLAEIAWRMIGG